MELSEDMDQKSSFIEAIQIIDSLIAQVPSERDIALDMRLALMHRSEPGTCIACYFKLKSRLSDWHQESLIKVREALEVSIQIEITLVEKGERSRGCLGLESSPDLNSYCHNKMKAAAMENKEAKNIALNFCWFSQ